MKLLYQFLFLSLFSFFIQAKNYIPGRYVVELSDPEYLEKRSPSGNVGFDFIHSLHRQYGFSAKIQYQFTSTRLFYGLSFTVSNIDCSNQFLKTLNSMTEVKKAWQCQTVQTNSLTVDQNQIYSNEYQVFKKRSQLPGQDKIKIHSNTQASKNKEKKLQFIMPIYQPKIIDNFVDENIIHGTSSLGSDDQNSMLGNVDFHQMTPKSQNRYSLEESDVCYTSSDSCSKDIGIFDNINKNEADTENEIRFDNGFWSSEQKNLSLSRWNPHLLTGVQTLHDRGLTGKGVIVGVIDSGAYYHDQGLGGGYGPNYKIKHGWNFAGSVYSQDFQTGFFGSNSDILDCYGHGTHVTGIIGGSNNSQFVGVAPDATIYSYKVFGCVGITSNDDIAQAMVMAYDDGCDVISMSLGIDGASFEDDPTAIIADRLVEHGVFVASSAANAGAVGPYYGNSVASGKKVASVGSCSTGQYIAYEGKLFSASGDWTSFAYVPTSGVQPNLTGTFMLKAYDKTGCSLAGTIPRNSNGENIALLFPESIHCKPDQFYLSIAQLGYPVILQYSLQNQFSFNDGYSKPDRGLHDPVAVRGTVPLGFGKWVMGQMNRGHNVSITFDADSLIPKSVITQNSIEELRMGLYSSWGPDYSGKLYPHITAPGTNIYSTYLNNTYSISSGTSMAAPYIAGVAALYYEAKKMCSLHVNAALEISTKMMQTASPIPFDTTSFSKRNFLAPLITQGFGLINATSLVDTNTIIVSDPILSMTVSTEIRQSFEIVLYNGNSIGVEYEIVHQPAVTVMSKRPDDKIFGYLPPVSSKTASIDLDATRIYIPAYSSRTVNLSINLPTEISPEYGPIYQGKITFRGSNLETVSAAYTGVYAEKYKAQSGLQQPFLIYDTINNASIAENENITISNDIDSFIYLPLLFGTTKVVSLIVDESFTTDNLMFPNFEQSPGIVGSIDSFPLTRTPRSTNGGFYGVSTDNSPNITDGTYRIFIASLSAIPAVSSSNSSLKDWETFLSEPFKYVSNPVPPTMQATESSALLNSSIFSNIQISSLNANSSFQIFPYDTVLVTISIQAPNGFPVGSTAELTLPDQFTAFPDPFLVYNDVGMAVLNTSISNDTNILRITAIEEWPVEYVTGSLIFTCFLKDPKQYTESKAVPLTFKKEDIEESSILMLFIELADTFFPSVKSIIDNSDGFVNVYIPASLKDWKNMEISIATEYPLSCKQIRVQESVSNHLEYGKGWDDIEFTTFGQPYSIECKGNLATVSLSKPPTGKMVGTARETDGNGGLDVRIVVPTKLGTPILVNSPVSAVIRCNLSDSELEYYLSDVLNSVSLNSQSMALTGKRLG